MVLFNIYLALILLHVACYDTPTAPLPYEKRTTARCILIPRLSPNTCPRPAGTPGGYVSLVHFLLSQPRVAHRALVDACASWWTQGAGHGNPGMALAIAEAAGRYGHVIFAGNIHAPALEARRDSNTIL